MSTPFRIQSAYGSLGEYPNVGWFEAWATGSLPTGKAGYVPGCILWYFSGGAVELYENTGTVTSAVWTAVSPQVYLQQDFGVPLDSFRVATTGAVLGSVASGVLGITMGTFGSAVPLLTGNAASGDTKTDVARFQWTVPPQYKPGGAINVVVTAKVGSLLNTSQTVNIEGYALVAGSLSSDLFSGTAQAITAAYLPYTFAATVTGLAAGMVLDNELICVANDTGGTTDAAITVTNVQVLCDTLY